MTYLRPISFSKDQYEIAKSRGGDARLVGLTVRNPAGGHVTITGIMSMKDCCEILGQLQAGTYRSANGGKLI